MEATAIAVVTGKWVGAARFERTAQHIAIGHAFSIALLRVKFEGTLPSTSGEFLWRWNRARHMAIEVTSCNGVVCDTCLVVGGRLDESGVKLQPMSTPNQPPDPYGSSPSGWQQPGYGPPSNPQLAPPPPGYPSQPGYPPRFPGYPAYPGYPGHPVDPQAPFGRDPATGVPLSERLRSCAWASSEPSSACSAFSPFRVCWPPASGPSSTRS